MTIERDNQRGDLETQTPFSCLGFVPIHLTQYLKCDPRFQSSGPLEDTPYGLKEPVAGCSACRFVQIARPAPSYRGHIE